METLKEVLSHYENHVATLVIIAVLTLARNLIANIISSIFIKIVVHGNWKTKIDKDNNGTLVEHEEATLRQFFHFVWGTTTDTNGKKYHVSGRIRGERLRLIYEIVRPGTDGGAVLLQVYANGNEMKGFELGIDAQTNEIYSKKYEWVKKP